MKPQNIRQIGIFQQSDTGAMSALDQVFGGIGRCTNIYVSMDHDRLAMVDNGSAFSDNANAFLTSVIASMQTLGATSYYLNVGLEPKAGYSFAESADGKKIAEQLARDIAELQDRARANGAQLDVTVRYASEMNLKPYPSGDKPHEEYSRTYRLVYGWMKSINPTIKMAYSPAINFEVDDTKLSVYFPGADVVDVISCTWYTNGANPRSSLHESMVRVAKYFLHRTGAHKPFGIDEIGGWDPANNSNDTYLATMFAALRHLSGRVSFEYVSVFLQNGPGERKWNQNPTLAFLRDAAP